MINTQEKLWYLKQLNLFENLSEEELMNISSKMHWKMYTCHELLYTPFNEVNSVYLLKKWEITIYYSHEWKRVIFDILTPWSIFWNLSFQASKSPHFAEASRDAFVCEFSKDSFSHIVAKHPELIFKLFQYSSDKMREYEEKMKWAVMNAKEKVLNQLKLLETKQRKFYHILSKRNITIYHEKLAEHIWLSRETVSRALQDLRNDGSIEIDDKWIITIL